MLDVEGFSSHLYKDSDGDSRQGPQEYSGIFSGFPILGSKSIDLNLNVSRGARLRNVIRAKTRPTPRLVLAPTTS